MGFDRINVNCNELSYLPIKKLIIVYDVNRKTSMDFEKKYYVLFYNEYNL